MSYIDIDTKLVSLEILLALTVYARELSVLTDICLSKTTLYAQQLCVLTDICIYKTILYAQKLSVLTDICLCKTILENFYSQT